MSGNKILFFVILVLLAIVDFLIINKESFINHKLKNSNNVFDKFDKFLYINLEHRKDRKDQILNELKKMKVPEQKIHRIDAVHEKYNGHIGCAKSHIKALEYAKKNKEKMVIIFEDDFIFTQNIETVNKRIEYFLNNFKNKWDVIQLTTVYKKIDDIEHIEDIKKVQRASTSSAYIINSNFYDKLINTLNESVYNMEKEMVEYNKKNNNILKKKNSTKYALDQFWYPLQKKSDWLIFYPYLGKQGGAASKSSIMSKNLEGFNSNSIRLYNLNI